MLKQTSIVFASAVYLMSPISMSRDNDAVPPLPWETTKDTLTVEQLSQQRISDGNIDIVLFARNTYTDQIGWAEAITRAQFWVAYTNASFERSGVDVHLNLVTYDPALSIPASQSIDGSEAFGTFSLFNQLGLSVRVPTDDPSYERALYLLTGTDLYGLVAENRPFRERNFVGLGSVGGQQTLTLDSASGGFGNIIFAHEVGHNLTGNHERESFDDPVGDAFASECDGQQTIMWSRVSSDSTNTYSNPNVFNRTEFCGEAGLEDNARNFNQQAPFTSIFGTAPEVSSEISLTSSPIVVNESQGEFAVTLSRTGDLTQGATAKLLLTSEQATFNADYYDEFATVFFNPGENLVTTRFPLVRDAIAEADEQARVELMFPILASINPDAASIPVTIINGIDGSAGEFTVSFAKTTIDESESVELTINRVGGSDGELLVWVDALLGLEDSEDQSISTVESEEIGYGRQQILFLDGQTSSSVIIPVTDDSIIESSEGFVVVVGNNAGVPVANDTTFITVVDNDDPATAAGVLTLGETAQAFDDKIGSLPISVVREIGLSGQISATLSVTGDGTAVASESYELVFANGESAQTVDVPVNNSVILAEAEIILSLSSDDVEIVEGEKTLILLADSQGTLSLQSQEIRIADDAGSIAFDVIRSDGTDNAITGTVSFDSQDVNGEKVVDQQSIDFSIDEGQSQLSFNIPVNNIFLRNDVVISAQLTSNDVPVTQGEVNIDVDADAIGTLSLQSSQSSIRDDIGNLTLSISRAGGSDNDITATLSVDSTAVNGSKVVEAQDFTVTLPDGETSRTVSVPVNDIELTNASTITATLTSNDADISVSRVTINVNADNSAQPPGSQAEQGGSSGGSIGALLSMLLVVLIGIRRRKPLAG